MSMTREEAILLSAYTGFMFAPDFGELQKFCEETIGRPVGTHEFADKQLFKDLRVKLQPKMKELIQNIDKPQTLTREQMEKMRGEWERGEYACGEHEWECSKCHETEWRSTCSRLKFCPFCGAPMTGEAVDIMLERLRKMNEE